MIRTSVNTISKTAYIFVIASHVEGTLSKVQKILFHFSTLFQNFIIATLTLLLLKQNSGLFFINN